MSPGNVTNAATVDGIVVQQCPFCGEKHDLAVNLNHVECLVCQCTGPYCDGEIDGQEVDLTEGGITLWNRRKLRFANGQHVFRHYGVSAG